MSEFCLVVKRGRLKGQVFPVGSGNSLVIGRSLHNDIHIPDQGISRKHCRIDNNENGLFIQDLGSSNGTEVNGLKVSNCFLNIGDNISLGATAMEVQDSSAVDSRVVESKKKKRQTTVNLIRDENRSTERLRRKYDPHRTDFPKNLTEIPELEQNRQRLSGICEMVNLIHSETTRENILATVAETVLNLTGADRSAIILVDEKTGIPVPSEIRFREEDSPQEFRVSNTIVEETLSQGVSQLSTDASSDDRFKLGASVVLYNVHSVMCVPVRTLEKIIGAIYVDCNDAAKVMGEQELAIASAVGQQAGIALERMRLVFDLEKLFVGSMHTIIASIEAKDSYTRGHSERVTGLALLIADRMELGQPTRNVLELSGLLHDVGKIGVPESVLLKPERLTDEEFNHIRKHPEAGARIIENMPEIDRIICMADIVEAVEYHHERYDGTGYPAGLAGNDIPLTSRILSVADTFDAITSDRIYRKARSGEAALQIINDCAGSQFDPEVVNAFAAVYSEGCQQQLERLSTRFGVTEPCVAE